MKYFSTGMTKMFAPNSLNPIVKPGNVSTVCTECKSKDVVFDAETAEQLCSSCGIVLAEKLESFDGGIVHTFNNIHDHFDALPSRLAQSGLATIIPYSTTDGNGSALNADQRSKMQRMIRWNKISYSNRNHHRNLTHAFSILFRIRDKLSLSQTVLEKAAYYYRKSLALNLLKGRSINGFIVACIYIACRETGMMRTLGEISKSIDTDHVFAGKCYRLLSRRLNIKVPQIDTGPLLSRIANYGALTEKTLRKAAYMMSIIKDNSVSYGKDPNALAAAVLYAACLTQGEKVHQIQLARAANLSVVTLRKRLEDVRKLFPEIPSGPK